MKLKEQKMGSTFTIPLVVQKATVDFDKKEATVEFDATVLTPEKLYATVEGAADGNTYKVVKK